MLVIFRERIFMVSKNIYTSKNKLQSLIRESEYLSNLEFKYMLEDILVSIGQNQKKVGLLLKNNNKAELLSITSDIINLLNL